MNFRLGAITIGQSPRDDVMPEIKEIVGKSVEIFECGALDEISLGQVNQFAPKKGERVLITRMRDGSSVVVAESHIIPRLQNCIKKLENVNVDLLIVLCTGFFPQLKSRKIILRPNNLLEKMVGAIFNEGTIGVVAPLKEQLSQTRLKWEMLGQKVIVDHASPYAAEDQVSFVARRLAKADVDLIILDCIGFNTTMKKTVREITKKPVILPRTLLARTISELLD